MSQVQSSLEKKRPTRIPPVVRLHASPREDKIGEINQDWIRTLLNPNTWPELVPGLIAVRSIFDACRLFNIRWPPTSVHVWLNEVVAATSMLVDVCRLVSHYLYEPVPLLPSHIRCVRLGLDYGKQATVYLTSDSCGYDLDRLVRNKFGLRINQQLYINTDTYQMLGPFQTIAQHESVLHQRVARIDVVSTTSGRFLSTSSDLDEFHRRTTSVVRYPTVIEHGRLTVNVALSETDVAQVIQYFWPHVFDAYGGQQRWQTGDRDCFYHLQIKIRNITLTNVRQYIARVLLNVGADFDLRW